MNLWRKFWRKFFKKVISFHVYAVSHPDGYEVFQCKMKDGPQILLQSAHPDFYDKEFKCVDYKYKGLEEIANKLRDETARLLVSQSADYIVIDFRPFHDIELAVGGIAMHCRPLDSREQGPFWHQYRMLFDRFGIR